MRMFSVAMNGSSAITCECTTFGHTCMPSAMFMRRVRITSVARNASGSVIRRIAESSRVRSNHWFACVLAAA